jgi:tetratricopeptide (TPR) repeat protein
MADLAENNMTMGKIDHKAAASGSGRRGDEVGGGAGAPDADQVRGALERVLASAELSASPRLSAFLRYVVETSLDGRAEEIKGYTIAVEALGRAPSFDPQTDPIVRVEATRLRRALDHFYAAAGAREPLRILIPRGSYVPVFDCRESEAAAPHVEPESPDTPQSGPPPGAEAVRSGRAASAAPRRWLAMGLAAAALTLALMVAAVEWASGPGAPLRADDQRVMLPVMEVAAFEAAGVEPPARGILRAFEERLGDALAQFDFITVRETMPAEISAPVACGSRGRSRFGLGTVAEGHADGTFSLLLRVTDRCAGVILWSRAVEGLRSDDDIAASARRMVRAVSGALLEAQGVVTARALATVRAEAPQSAYGCVARAFGLLSRTGGESPAAVRACLDGLTRQLPGFAMGHALKAMALLAEATGESAYDPTPGRAAQMLASAERAVELAPASAYAARTLALVQAFLGEYRAAVDTATRALQLNPHDATVAAGVGMVYIAAGRVAEGEELLANAEADGAQAGPLKDTYLALAAFLRADEATALALLPQLEMHPSHENALALALALNALHRPGEERRAVAALANDVAGGADAIRRMVHRLLPAPGLADRAIAALEAAGLGQHAAMAQPRKGG